LQFTITSDKSGGGVIFGSNKEKILKHIK
jgi:hypothetical protein